MATYQKCRPTASFSPLPRPRVSIHARNADDVWLVGAASRNIETISTHLYIAHIDSGLNGSQAAQTYTLDIEVVGNAPELHRVVALASANRLFTESDKHLSDLRDAARLTLRTPIAARAQLHLNVTTIDEPLIVKAVALAVLRRAGTFHRFHGETVNSGRFAGTADFVIDALIGFASTAQADAAWKALDSLPYDYVKVTRLYGATSRRAVVNSAA